MPEDDREEAPAAAEDPYRALFENALVGLGVADMQGNLLAFNDAMLRPSGFTREDIHELGNVAKLYADSVDRERVLELVGKHGYVWREEVRFLRKDGSAFDSLLTLTPVLFRGEPCMYATVEDITEQKRHEARRRELEAQLFKAQKMEAVGEMTAGIAHDFNNLLSIVRSSCDMMALSLGSGARTGEEVEEYLGNIREASQLGATMIQKLLGFSRTAELDVVPTDVVELLVEMRGMVRAVIPPGIEVTVEGSGPVVALCDPRAVEQMVLNLATNAADAMPEGGRVRLVVEPWSTMDHEETRPEWIPHGEYVRVAVADSGLGMDERTRARALEPFFTTKPAGAGTGLGLPMVFGLAKQQGGYLELVSEPGAGTTVNLYFPRVPD